MMSAESLLPQYCDNIPYTREFFSDNTLMLQGVLSVLERSTCGATGEKEVTCLRSAKGKPLTFQTSVMKS